MSFQQQHGNALLQGTNSNVSSAAAGLLNINSGGIGGGGNLKSSGAGGSGGVDSEGRVLTSLTPHDVLLGRGNGVNNRAGNVNFRKLVESHRDAYTRARRQDKVAIARAVVDHVHSKGGRFLKLLWTGAGGGDNAKDVEGAMTDIQYHETYKQISQARAIEKACQALREGCSGRKQQRAFVKAALALRNGSGRLKRGLGKKADTNANGTEPSEHMATTSSDGSAADPGTGLNPYNPSAAIPPNIPGVIHPTARPASAASAAVAAHAAFAAAAAASTHTTMGNNAAANNHYAAVKNAYYNNNHDSHMNNNDRVRQELMSRVMLLSKAASSQWEPPPEAAAATPASTSQSTMSPSALLPDALSHSAALLQLKEAVRISEQYQDAESKQMLNNKSNPSNHKKHRLELPSQSKSKKVKPASLPLPPQSKPSYDKLPSPPSLSSPKPMVLPEKQNKDISVTTDSNVTRSASCAWYDDKDWDDMYKQVLDFRKETGHCAIPPLHESNQQLADWACYQRQVYREIDKGFREATEVEKSRVNRLQQIRFCWNYNEWHWEHQYRELCAKSKNTRQAKEQPEKENGQEGHGEKQKEEQKEKQEQKGVEGLAQEQIPQKDKEHPKSVQDKDQENGNELLRKRKQNDDAGSQLKNCLSLSLWVKDQREQFSDGVEGNGHAMAEERAQKLESFFSSSLSFEPPLFFKTKSH